MFLYRVRGEAENLADLDVRFSHDESVEDADLASGEGGEVGAGFADEVATGVFDAAITEGHDEAAAVALPAERVRVARGDPAGERVGQAPAVRARREVALEQAGDLVADEQDAATGGPTTRMPLGRRREVKQSFASSVRSQTEFGNKGSWAKSSAVAGRRYRNSVAEIVDGAGGRDIVAACDFGEE